MGAYNFGTRTLEGIARSLISDNPDAAIAAFERSLELAPVNPVATRRLEQLRGRGQNNNQ